MDPSYKQVALEDADALLAEPSAEVHFKQQVCSPPRACTHRHVHVRVRLADLPFLLRLFSPYSTSARK
jgi:hypothetical protein